MDERIRQKNRPKRSERSAHGVEEEIREKTIPLDQDSGGEREPNRGHDRCSSKKFLHREKEKDFVSRDLAKDILEAEEEHVDWLETQLSLIDRVGEQNYLQTAMKTVKPQ